MKIELFEIGNSVKCPHCGASNKRAESHKQDMQIYGKTVFDCEGCGRLFTLADDGDGEYVHIPRSQSL